MKKQKKREEKKSTLSKSQLSFFSSTSFSLPPTNLKQATMPLQISSLSADFKTRASSPYLVFECEGVRAQTKATKVR